MQSTACILCSRNCGIEVEVQDGHLTHIRGDEKHPLSEGYLCQKAARLDHYQNHSDRLSSPLRRRADGTYEEISWETALSEIAQKIRALRDTHSGRALAFYGGGGQGNHLGGLYSRGLVEAMRTRFHYTSLAQEKTGDFWVNGRLFGKQTCHVAEAVEEAELVIFIGTNPWQAHGIRNARDTLRALSKDEKRKIVVIDPKRTETADLADLHLQVKPGMDAFLLTAILAQVVRDGREGKAFLEARTTGFDAVKAALLEVPVETFAARAGVPLEQVQKVAQWLGEAKSAAVRADLGLQQSLHSTLNSYLEKLLALVPGHFGREGCNMLHSFFVPLVGHSDDAGPESRSWKTTATGILEIGKLFPPNVLPAEIDNERPDRLRGLVVDSANVVLTASDTTAVKQALGKLELLVVVDVAMTETARLAHYVLPASSQFEKWETTFFNLEFPTQALQLRKPLFAPRAGTLAEPEIYRRLLVELGELPREGFPLLRAIAKLDRRVPRLRLFPTALAALFKLRPRLQKFAVYVLYDTLGRALPEGAAAAAPLWGAAHGYANRHPAAVRRAGLTGEGADLGEALFARLLERREGTAISTHTHEEAWKFVRHADGRVHLAIPELLAEIRALATEPEARADAQFPLVLIAGERRSYNANQIFRDPDWRKSDKDGALHIHPDDAGALGLTDGARAICESSRGQLEVTVLLSDALRPGLVTLPHGFGAEHPDAQGKRTARGPALNVLTDALHRDPLTATPYHKHVRVRVRAATALLVSLLALGACKGSSNDVQLDPPADGFQLSTGSFDVPQATEVQRCYFFTVKGEGTDPIWVNRLVAAQNEGSHHLTVFRVKTIVNLDGADGAVVDGGECWKSGNWADWPLVMNSQESQPGHNIVDWTLPSSVAQRFTPGEKLMLQSHFVNASTQSTPGHGKGIMNFYRTRQVDPPLIELGTVFATDQNIRICPGDTMKAFSATCRFARDSVTILAANGHFHSRGREFDMNVVDSQNQAVGSTFYTSTEWDDPVFFHDLDVTVPQNGGFGWTCKYTLASNECADPNDSCCATFGGHVETQEHCNAFVYYYPKLVDATCF